MRNVRGVLFLDYVRMLRSQKGVDWSTLLPPEDMALLGTKIDPDAWYPMATFERMGNLILRRVAGDELFPVQLWGRYSAAQLRMAHPTLLEPNNPIETINRFRVLRATFFDFTALEIPMLHDDEAQVVINYYMGVTAEEAAAHQTLGFFEGLLGLAGASDVDARFAQRSWAGDPRTLLELRWTSPPQNAPA